MIGQERRVVPLANLYAIGHILFDRPGLPPPRAPMRHAHAPTPPRAHPALPRREVLHGRPVPPCL